jgi:uncharacterized membrane protein YsdA (DUF1294 family)
MGRGSDPYSHAGGLYGAAIIRAIYNLSLRSSLLPPLAESGLKKKVHNEKTITRLHKTTRVTALSVPGVFLALYAVFNIIAFFLFIHDKQKAKSNAWRTPENLLLVVAATGPFGAYGAMVLFRHKTRKLKFYLVPVFLIVHCVTIICLFR